jgi:hypothetical protein
MIFLYSFLLLFLGAVKLLVDRRVARLEKKYCTTAKAAERLVREPPYRPGNGNRPDPCEGAKRQYQLGLLVQKRDRLEARYAAWQGCSEKFGRFVSRARAWKGKKLPYTMGALDVSAVFYLADRLGAADLVNLRHLAEQVAALVSR